jgi:hypothetical protein
MYVTSKQGRKEGRIAIAMPLLKETKGILA